LKHSVSPKFRALYEALPKQIQDLADKNYRLLKSDPQHPSLHFKKLGGHWSVRVGGNYRALAIEVEGGMYWFRIGRVRQADQVAPRDRSKTVQRWA
jgi:hypothetical protein